MRISNSLGFFFIKAITTLIAANVSIKRMQVNLKNNLIPIFKNSKFLKGFLLEKEMFKMNELSKATDSYVKVVNLKARWPHVILNKYYKT